jgi:hypothetical protein
LTGGLTGGQIGRAGIGTGLTGGLNSVGMNTMGIRRAPAYSTTLGYTLRPAAPLRLRADLQQVLSQSTRLTAPGNIQIVMDGPTIVLRGRVTDERERRLAENVLRLSPGVRDIRNELEVSAP